MQGINRQNSQDMLLRESPQKHLKERAISIGKLIDARKVGIITEMHNRAKHEDKSENKKRK